MNANDIRLAAQADFEAACRYRELAAKNPSLRRDYLRRAELAQQAGEAKVTAIAKTEGGSI